MILKDSTKIQDKMAQNYEMRVKLSNFIDSRIVEQEDDNGVMEKGIFIPIDKNALYVNDHKCVYFSAFVTEKISNTGDGASHYIKQKTNKEHIATLNSLGYKTPNLGSMWEKNYRPRFQNVPVTNAEPKRVKIGND